jgi:hypothetical protein
MLLCREQLARIPKKPSEEDGAAAHAQLVLREKLRIYTDLCGRVPDDLLGKHVHAALGADAEALWSLKRALAMQLAAVSLLGHLFTVGERTPERFVFSKRNGRLLASEFRPVYRPEGQLEPSEVRGKEGTGF